MKLLTNGDVIFKANGKEYLLDRSRIEACLSLGLTAEEFSDLCFRWVADGILKEVPHG